MALSRCDWTKKGNTELDQQSKLKTSRVTWNDRRRLLREQHES
ncbi:hypothetical protein [Lentibacillus kimchii]|uniref:Uncharacterized protein n=1 Tax=Lentibacillus kimchii TaxID=1542911 RepID=A0ABW2UYZ5_9BACI